MRRARGALRYPPRVIDGRVVVERERGHELIPRLVEALPAGRDRLAVDAPADAVDVFVKLTGRSLRDEGNAESRGLAGERRRGARKGL